MKAVIPLPPINLADIPAGADPASYGRDADISIANLEEMMKEEMVTEIGLDVTPHAPAPVTPQISTGLSLVSQFSQAIENRPVDGAPITDALNAHMLSLKTIFESEVMSWESEIKDLRASVVALRTEVAGKVRDLRATIVDRRAAIAALNKAMPAFQTKAAPKSKRKRVSEKPLPFSEITDVTEETPPAET